MFDKKILIISNSSKSVLNFRGKLIDDLISKGLQVIVLLKEPEDSTEVTKELQKKGCIVENIYLNRAGISIKDDLKTLFCIYKVIKKHKPEYVLSYTIKPVIYGAISSKMLGLKNIYSLITGLGYTFVSLDNPKHTITKTQKIIFSLYKIALLFSKKVIFQNPDDANLFKTLKLVDSKKTYIVNGSGVDLSHYTFDLKLLEEYTSSQPLRILMLGRIIGDKGVREYINAAKQLKKKYGQKVIFQLGGGLDSNPTAIQKEELDGWVASGVIEYLGRLSDVRPAITNSHIFILPSYREGTSRSILEAMSIGRPIVTTNVPGCRQLVEVNCNGYLAEPKSVESLVHAIEKIMNLSTRELVQMGIYSRKIVEEKYDVHKVNKHMLAIMDIK